MAQPKGTLGRGSQKKKAVSFIIRDTNTNLSCAGVNALCLDPTNHLLYTAGRDSVIRIWDVENSDKKIIKVSESRNTHL